MTKIKKWKTVGMQQQMKNKKYCSISNLHFSQLLIFPLFFSAIICFANWALNCTGICFDLGLRWITKENNKNHTVKWYKKCFSGFIAQLVRASHRYREVTGSNPVEVLTFSGFYTQLLKLRSQLRWSLLTWRIILFLKQAILSRIIFKHTTTYFLMCLTGKY